MLHASCRTAAQIKQSSKTMNLAAELNQTIQFIFYFSWTMEDLNAKGVMLRAFDQFRLKSCIDFKPRHFEEYYLHVQKLGGYACAFLAFLSWTKYFNTDFQVIK